MQNRKTINSVINRKFNEFLESITDERVKNLVKDNTIITGGCIASMLLNEEVKDFDLYFRNLETVTAVANYYVNVWNTQHPTGRKGEVRTEEGQVSIFFKSDGVVSDLKEGEISITDETQENKPAAEDETKKYKPVYITSNAITLWGKIQLVIRFYGCPSKVHDTYDYIHCTNYWDSADKKVILNTAALESLLTKELVYVGSKYPLASVIRSRKFINRGWFINAGQYLKMCFQISQLDLTDINVLKDQLIGVDVTYFNWLISSIQEDRKKSEEAGQPLQINYQYLVDLIDQIF